MIEIPRITPVRVKTEPINPELINPGTRGYYFPDGVGPRVVYLDARYNYPEQTDFTDKHAERRRQVGIWSQLCNEGGADFLDRHVEKAVGKEACTEAEAEALAQVGNRSSAEYLEKVATRLLNMPGMNLVIIATGITLFDRTNYHEIGYLI